MTAAELAGALLTAAGLPELICENLQRYEDMGVALALEPGATARLRKQLEAVRADGVLFDTDRFVGHLEAQFEALAAGTR